jgi:hypothetical protein
MSASDLEDDLHVPNNAERRAADSDSSEEDLLSEVDEALFANFDPRTAASLANRIHDGIPLDESNVTSVGVHKRKRSDAAPVDSPSASDDDEDEYEEPDKAARRAGKPSASGARREKQPRQRRRAAERDDEVAARPAGEKRRRAPKPPSERKAKAKAVDDENLTPEESASIPFRWGQADVSRAEKTSGPGYGRRAAEPKLAAEEEGRHRADSPVRHKS